MNLILRKTLPLLAIARCRRPARRQRPRRPPARHRRTDCVAVGDLDVSVSLGYGTRTNPVVGTLRHPAVRHSARQLLRQAVLPGEPRAGRDAVRERRAHVQPDRDAGLRPRVLQPQRSAERGRAAGRRGAVASAADRPRTQAFPVGRRHTTYLAGPEWMFRHRNFIGQVSALYEVTGRHEGYEVRAAVSAPLVQTQAIAGGQRRPDLEERGDRRLLLWRAGSLSTPTARSIRSSS